MPFVLALLAALAGAYFWINRARGAARGAQELADMAGDVMSAARRFGFRRRANIHPVDSIEDPALAIAGAGIAFLELGGLPSAEQQAALAVSLQAQLDLPADRAAEALILGRWLMSECGGPEPALTRLARRLYKMDAGQLTPLMAVMKDVAAAGRAEMSAKQREAIDDIARAFRLR